MTPRRARVVESKIIIPICPVNGRFSAVVQTVLLHPTPEGVHGAMPIRADLSHIDLAAMSLPDLHRLVDKIEKAIEIKLAERGAQRALAVFSAHAPTPAAAPPVGRGGNRDVRRTGRERSGRDSGLRRR